MERVNEENNIWIVDNSNGINGRVATLPLMPLLLSTIQILFSSFTLSIFINLRIVTKESKLLVNFYINVLLKS